MTVPAQALVGVLLRRIGSLLGRIEAILGVVERPEAVSEASWNILEAFWDPDGHCGRRGTGARGALRAAPEAPRLHRFPGPSRTHFTRHCNVDKELTRGLRCAKWHAMADMLPKG